jgi:hypothetical protein
MGRILARDDQCEGRSAEPRLQPVPPNASSSDDISIDASRVRTCSLLHAIRFKKHRGTTSDLSANNHTMVGSISFTATDVSFGTRKRAATGSLQAKVGTRKFKSQAVWSNYDVSSFEIKEASKPRNPYMRSLMKQQKAKASLYSASPFSSSSKSVSGSLMAHSLVVPPRRLCTHRLQTGSERT